MASKLEKIVRNVISENLDAPVEYNIRPDWLSMPCGTRCELDIFIPSLSLAIEVQGKQHYEFVPHFHGEYSNFQRQQARDKWKAEICEARRINLILVHSKDDLFMMGETICKAIRSATKGIDIHTLKSSVSHDPVQLERLLKAYAALDAAKQNYRRHERKHAASGNAGRSIGMNRYRKRIKRAEGMIICTLHRAMATRQLAA